MNKHFMAGSNFLWSSVRLQVLICFIILSQVIRPLGRWCGKRVWSASQPHPCAAFRMGKKNRLKWCLYFWNIDSCLLWKIFLHTGAQYFLQSVTQVSVRRWCFALIPHTACSPSLSSASASCVVDDEDAPASQSLLEHTCADFSAPNQSVKKKKIQGKLSIFGHRPTKNNLLLCFLWDVLRSTSRLPNSADFNP